MTVSTWQLGLLCLSVCEKVELFTTNYLKQYSMKIVVTKETVFIEILVTIFIFNLTEYKRDKLDLFTRALVAYRVVSTIMHMYFGFRNT